MGICSISCRLNRTILRSCQELCLWMRLIVCTCFCTFFIFVALPYCWPCNTPSNSGTTNREKEENLGAGHSYNMLWHDLYTHFLNILLLCVILATELLQPVMFSLYGNQYESREEYLLLMMFEVCFCWTLGFMERVKEGWFRRRLAWFLVCWWKIGNVQLSLDYV